MAPALARLQGQLALLHHLCISLGAEFVHRWRSQASATLLVGSGQAQAQPRSGTHSARVSLLPSRAIWVPVIGHSRPCHRTAWRIPRLYRQLVTSAMATMWLSSKYGFKRNMDGDQTLAHCSGRRTGTSSGEANFISGCRVAPWGGVRGLTG